MLWKSMANINCPPTNILQNIFFFLLKRRKKLTLEQLDGE